MSHILVAAHGENQAGTELEAPWLYLAFFVLESMMTLLREN